VGEALDSAKNIERTIEVEKALLLEKKMTIVKERAEELLTESKQIIRTGKVRKALISSGQGFKLKTVGTSKFAGAIRQKTLYCLFLVTFGIWTVLLLAICLPISGLTTPVFPLTINNTMIMSFLVSAGIASILSLIIGISKLRGKG
jgi:hypothetical protein